MRTLIAVMVFTLSPLSAVGQSHTQPWTWISLDPPGASFTIAYGIDGSTVVGDYESTSGTHAFVYNSGTWTSLDYPGAISTVAMGISGNSIV